MLAFKLKMKRFAPHFETESGVQMGSGASASPLVTPLASPTSAMWSYPLASPQHPLPAQTDALAHSTPSCATASPMEPLADSSHLQPALTTTITPQPPQSLPATSTELPAAKDFLLPGDSQAMASSSEERPDQDAAPPPVEPPARFAIKALRGVGRTLHVSPSPLGTTGSTHAHSIVSGLVGQLQGVHPHIPRKPSRLQEESKPKPLLEPSADSPRAPLNSIIHPGIPISHGNGFFNYFHRPVADRQHHPGHAHPGQAETGRRLGTDDQEPSGPEPATSLVLGAVPAVESTVDIKIGLESDMAKLVGSRNSSVGIPDTPSLGHEDRGLFSAALWALDSGLGASLSSSGPSLGAPMGGGTLSRKDSGHSLDLPGIAEDSAAPQDFFVMSDEPCLAADDKTA